MSSGRATEFVDRDWRFARRPFWLFSHCFGASVIVLFLFLGFWQWDRLGERSDANAIIESRAFGSPLVVDERPIDTADLDYRLAVVRGRVVDADFARIANRSQGGVAGQHVVALIELADGSELAVNRGFVPLNADVALDPVPEGEVELEGWLRASVVKGWFGATDTGEGLLPRFDTAQLAVRRGGELPDVWLQLGDRADDGATVGSGFPDSVPLPPLGEGSHRSYAFQWWTFAVLGAGFYLALLFRRAGEAARGDD